MQHPLIAIGIKGFHSYPYPHLRTTYMVVLVKFSLLHKNMEVIDEKQEHSLNYIYVNKVIN
jgi:hypothetical protein